MPPRQTYSRSPSAREDSELQWRHRTRSKEARAEVPRHTVNDAIRRQQRRHLHHGLIHRSSCARMWQWMTKKPNLDNRRSGAGLKSHLDDLGAVAFRHGRCTTAIGKKSHQNHVRGRRPPRTAFHGVGLIGIHAALSPYESKLGIGESVHRSRSVGQRRVRAKDSVTCERML